MNLPFDIVERVGKTLDTRDLASFCRTTPSVARVVRPELTKRRTAELDTFRIEVRKAVRVLKMQLLRSMIRQLNDIPELENGHFPHVGNEEGSIISFTTMPEWKFTEPMGGVMHGSCFMSCGTRMQVSVAYGQSRGDDLIPKRMWLGACISSVGLTKLDGTVLGKWVSTRPWSFRNEFALPTRIGFLENDVGMFWVEPSDLLAPMSGLDVCNFPWPGVSPSFREHVWITEQELNSKPDDPASKIFQAWTDASIVLLDRYRTRTNDPNWLHTDYAVATPDWMISEFPRAGVFAAFERALGPEWKIEIDAFRTVTASIPWRSGNLVTTYDIESNWRDVRFNDGIMTAMFRFEAPGLTCTVVRDGVTDGDAITDDVREFANLAKRAGMPVLVM